MRFTFACVIAFAAAHTPRVFDTNAMTSTTTWAIDGVKGFYDGYYSSFYKSSLPQNMQTCLNEDGIKDIVEVEKIMMDPLSIFTQIADISGDMKRFQVFAGVFENLSDCHFEESIFDIITFCTKSPGDCMIN